ncbi:MAG TPA: phosphate signaling complex protein PhoU [Pirellulales bacterium]|nr:phosphate signaling complex protein PhoU [Pirellulales bacterium]
MSKHILRQVERLKERIIGVGAVTQTAIADAIGALVAYDEASARRVMQANVDVDRATIEIQEECLKTFALYQPLVGDLRLVVAVLKINNELERIAKLSKNIAKRVLYLITVGGGGVAFDFRPMASHAQEMVSASLDALVRADSKTAHQVRRDDDALDAMRRSIHKQIRIAISEDPRQTERLLKFYAVAKHLERIGDMATNIAADVIYMVDGEIVRHTQEA